MPVFQQQERYETEFLPITNGHNGAKEQLLSRFIIRWAHYKASIIGIERGIILSKES